MPSSKRRKRAKWTAIAVAVVLGAALFIRVLMHPVYSAGSPKVRVTVAGGCPQAVDAGGDVSNPGPGFWSEIWHYSKLARSGATSGLVCVYGEAAVQAPIGLPTDGPPAANQVSALSAVVPLVKPRLQEHYVLTQAQSSAVSAGASSAHISRGGSAICPSDSLGAVVIVALRYPTGPDADIWWNDTGCQTADNGHVQLDMWGPGDDGGDFTAPLQGLLLPQ